jgi:hypothetical protein
VRAIPERIPDRPIRLIPMGTLREWTVVRGRVELIAERPGVLRRFVFTRVTPTSVDATAERWLELQRTFAGLRMPRGRVDVTGGAGSEAPPAVQRSRVFWRLTLGQGSLALGAQTFATIEQARAHTEQLSGRADDLIVYFVFAEHRRLPLWLVADREGTPAFLGMPDTHLSATFDPDVSLAAVLKQARPLDYVHRASQSDPPSRPSSGRAEARP